MWSGCGYPPVSSYVVTTCGLKSRISWTRRSVASSNGTSAKQPSGSGGFGSPSGQPESTKPSQSWRMPRMSRARSISWRPTSVMFAATAGGSILGSRSEPRSPPVQVATWTSTPCATYIAVDAAPLLDSSSGWACTCIRRRPSPGRAGSGDMVRSLGGTIGGVEQTLTERYAAAPAWRRPVTIAVVAVVALIGLGWLAWAAYDESTPKVESELVTFDVVDEHSVSAQ